jgi:hypothetical protein
MISKNFSRAKEEYRIFASLKVSLRGHPVGVTHKDVKPFLRDGLVRVSRYQRYVGITSYELTAKGEEVKGYRQYERAVFYPRIKRERHWRNFASDARDEYNAEYQDYINGQF